MKNYPRCEMKIRNYRNEVTGAVPGLLIGKSTCVYKQPGAKGYWIGHIPSGFHIMHGAIRAFLTVDRRRGKQRAMKKAEALVFAEAIATACDQYPEYHLDNPEDMRPVLPKILAALAETVNKLGVTPAPLK